MDCMIRIQNRTHYCLIGDLTMELSQEIAFMRKHLIKRGVEIDAAHFAKQMIDALLQNGIPRYITLGANAVNLSVSVSVMVFLQRPFSIFLQRPLWKKKLRR
ncbi:hypothetical protein FRX31_003642 [Thalictrum thalictroides]|uniref:Uncharacterized protein n=1 Tax=Thalictrum thalictroides TaxID=46969 RepID=A0A7J6XBB0_THATH|nr:hypothetical protein FRX31_003642 [Thalictrum thalictroides]